MRLPVPISTTVKVTGLDGLGRSLDSLKKATSGNVLTRSLKTAGEPLKVEAHRIAPDDPRSGGRDLKNSITIEALKGKARGTFARVVRIAPSLPFEKTAKGKPGGRWFAAQALEFAYGDMPLKPYMRPAWDHTHGKVLDAFTDALRLEIQKAIARQLKKG